MVTTIFSRSQFNGKDFNELLNAIDKAALLVEKRGIKILAANSQAIELSTYTRAELATINVNDLFGRDESKEISKIEGVESLDLCTELITRYNQPISISIQAISLGEDSPWALLLITRKDTISKRVDQQDSLEKLLTYPNNFAKALVNDDPDASLTRVLETASIFFPDSELAVYIGNSKRLQKIVFQGDDKTFPSEIFHPDLNYFQKSTQWVKGQRSIFTLLHQRARAAGVKYILSVPIDEEQPWIGTIIIGGFQDKIPDTINLRKNILATIVSAIIQNNITRTIMHGELIKIQHEISISRTVGDNIKDGIITVNNNLSIKNINPSAELILGYASREVAGQSIENILVGTDRLIPAISKAIEGINTPNLGAINLHRRDGSAFPAHVSVYPVAKDGSINSILLLLRDKSEREQARLRTQQLEQQALLGEVTSVFAHEVRNPINNISMGLQLIEQSFSSDPQNQERVTRMQEDCQRLTDLMESVLTFSRTGTYRFKIIQVEELIERLLSRWRPRLKRVNITYHAKTPDNLPPVWGDQRSLEQVFTNIISNAVNAMKDSGGTLAIRFTLTAPLPGKSFVQIDISDTGPGIPEDHQQRIFDPFFTTNPGGTGLGLAITKQIVTAHRGSITLTSFPGGTVFHIQLPTKPETEV
ncbi:MAG: PAS domain-containing protein [Anaerolineae bacterium]|nr:PAS domain-containing protein [Anaerolineae bacterium]